MANWPHGTPSAYVNHKCRCDLCKNGWAEYRRSYNALRRTQPPRSSGRRLRMHGPWTRMEILRAAEKWIKRYGTQPLARDWEKKLSNEFPTSRSVYSVFGGWNRFLDAAGFHTTRPNWNKYRIGVALDKWMEEYNRLPVSRDFKGHLNGQYPSSATIERHFKTITAARKYALELRRRRKAA